MRSGLLACVLLIMPVLAGVAPGQRVESGFNSGWRFAAGQQDRTVVEPEFDDLRWKDVHLPHDWAIAGPFDPAQDGQTGKLPWRGEGWYRKRFRLEAADRGRCVYLDFGGVMAAPKVFINGRLAGEWDYGYMAFRVDLTPHVRFDAENVVAVHADTRSHSSRWYPGAGIFRKVLMTVCDPVHVAHWGTCVTTAVMEDCEAQVSISTAVENLSGMHCRVGLESVVYDPRGRQVGVREDVAFIRVGSTNIFTQKIVVRDPCCWDIGNPQCYTLRSRVSSGGRICDEMATVFGIRTIRWTAGAGFRLNGRRVQIKGVNLHHDQGPLGAALYPRALERQLEIMREMGCNAIRSSHNMPPKELPELCDRMGLLLYEECLDKWHGRTDAGFVKKQLAAMVRRDRNHPSVICWSIGNELPHIEESQVENSPEVVRDFADLVRALDPTRPVTQGCFLPGAAGKGATAGLDLNDYHYGRGYAVAREIYPQRPSVYGESASTVSTRGFYRLPLPVKKDDFALESLQVDSFDRNAPGYADIPDVEFNRMEKDSYCAGEFVWTGFDYLGEPSPYDARLAGKGVISNQQTGVSSYFGIVDLCGIPKDRYYLYRSHWAPLRATVHILPHWNWLERGSNAVPVYVYSNGDEAELFLNGRSLGRRRKVAEPPATNDYYGVMEKYRLMWAAVPYEPGELRAVAYRYGVAVGEAVMRTADTPFQLRLTPDRTELAATGEDLSYILVDVVDRYGVSCPLAGDHVDFEVEGPAEIAGIGNGNPRSVEPFQDAGHSLFFGKAMLIVRAVEGKYGRVAVRARSLTLRDAEVALRVRK